MLVVELAEEVARFDLGCSWKSCLVGVKVVSRRFFFSVEGDAESAVRSSMVIPLLSVAITA